MLVTVAESGGGSKEGAQQEEGGRQDVPDRNPCEALKTLDCWLLMWADSWAQASGGMVALSLGQLVESNGGHDSSFFVSLFSVANATGRACLGLGTDVLVRRGFPRSVGLLCISVLFTLMGVLGALTKVLSHLSLSP